MKLVAAIFSAAIFIATAANAYSQSLADLANREKQRREKLNETPDAITNDTVSQHSGGSVSTMSPILLPSGETDSENTEGKVESKKQGQEADPDEPVDFNGRPESYWRETMAEANKKVKDLEDESNVLILKLNDLQTQFYNAGDGFTREKVQREIQKTYYEQDQNKENLAKASEELTDLEKEAKKSGALPGWLTSKDSK